TLIKRRYHHLLDDTGQEFMFFVVDAVHQMQTLLDDLLTYSRVNNNGSTQKVSVSDVLFMVRSNLKLDLEEQGGQLLVQEDKLPVIQANQSQVIQLFQNLVSNAMKFRGKRAPIVTIDCEQQQDDLIFSIKDNGIGIPGDQQQHIFEMFRRLHTKEEYEGSGIGLATCKRIVQNLGGQIWVESTEGSGSTFYCSFPSSIVVEELVLA
ncbi:MAG: ATP-binding protein, partial [Bacteroidota bacterium]